MSMSHVHAMWEYRITEYKRMPHEFDDKFYMQAKLHDIHMVSNDEALTVGAGAIGGIGVPFLVRKYYDVDDTGALRQFVPQLGSYGTPSAVVGIGTGIAGIAAGMFGDKLGLRDERMKTAAFAYGVTALASGIVSGYEPVQAVPAAAARARVIRSAAAPMAAQMQVRAAPAAAPAAITSRRPRTY